MLSIMYLFRGIGNILSTPISTVLQTGSHNNIGNFTAVGSSSSITVDYAYNAQYEKVVLYVGTCFAAASIVLVFGWAVTALLNNRR